MWCKSLSYRRWVVLIAKQTSEMPYLQRWLVWWFGSSEILTKVLVLLWVGWRTTSGWKASEGDRHFFFPTDTPREYAKSEFHLREPYQFDSRVFENTNSSNEVFISAINISYRKKPDEVVSGQIFRNTYWSYSFLNQILDAQYVHDHTRYHSSKFWSQD